MPLSSTQPVFRQDRIGARAVLTRLFRWLPNIQKVFADGGDTGKLIGWTADMFAATLEIVKRSDAGKFVVLPKRWIVERTFAWLALCRDYEIIPRQSESMIQLAMIRLLVKRLADFKTASEGAPECPLAYPQLLPASAILYSSFHTLLRISSSVTPVAIPFASSPASSQEN
ncbi:hypothetical protein AGMMS49545_01880 [Betaproteobacteria bacterium]|nr:hypothetical protein AGMMS49545_01880 [Betaproteobacteria bacterium]GHU43680.1 hypothetical protein AGMMS50289_10510 [Betaproteobacteria bacterium]